MKKHLNYWLALALLLPALHACNDNDTLPGEEPGTAGTPTVIRASIGSEPDTRAQVKWGTQNAAEGEYFMWNANDQFRAYNITTAETTAPPTAYIFAISNYNEAQPGNQADFRCGAVFPATVGNKVAAFYGNSVTNATAVTGANGEKGIQVTLTTPTTLAQVQTATPGNTDLRHLQHGLYMYALTEAGENGDVSPLSFRHLSALFRFTIRNQQGTDVKIPKIGISFNGQKVICQEKTVTLWADNAMTYTVDEADKQDAAKFSLKGVNGINAYATIASGSSYDCFFPAMPVAEEGNTASSITIGVEFSDNSVQSLTIAGFNGVAIEAGMRYWFDLTVKADGTLVQTRTLTDYAWYDKDATEYTLSNAKQLRALARLVNGDPEALSAAGVSGAVNFAGKTVRIADDVTELDLASEAWEPIGTANMTTRETTPFKGTFDGNNKEIKNILINRPSDNYQGLFGVIDGATIQNVKIASGSITADGNVGGIAGVAQNGSRIIACENRAEVNGKTSAIGGIAGYKSSTDVIACQNYGQISGGTSGQNVGGIVGSSNSGDIIACINHGGISGWAINGGIVGYMDNIISGLIGACLNEGEVAVSSGTKGGIAGIMATFTADTYAENYFYGTSEFPKAVGKVGNDQSGVGDAGIPYTDINSKVDALNGVISTWNAAHPGKECAYRYAASPTPDSALPTLTKQTP